MRRLAMTVAAMVLGALPAGCAAQAGDRRPRVVLETGAGRMAIALELDRAPLSVCNFLSYVTDGDYDGGAFFRTAVRASDPGPHPIDVIQAATPRGPDDDLRPPVPLESTRDTGLRHVAGAVSLARDGPETATSSFFIVTADTPALDHGGGRNPDGQGFAVFGFLVEGLDVARRIHASPADAGERLTPPIAIRSARLTGEVPPECRP
ncbi:peptidylprolyl isomerase [Brevundimonas sp.]|uniref:peptidylprolyl isomerase n=1 Tax=Brevundimonas sp. TaxID=1871086 RepID=UPI002C762D68|nr:peptidylprolyl isomerase [Brevundimonas sp.]HWQ87776.1 peptidylprolyl isomerase [Brevundimonas sp.]